MDERRINTETKNSGEKKTGRKRKTDGLDRVLIAVALLSAAAGMVCAVYYYDIYPVFHAADAVIIASFCVLAAVLAVSIFRLIVHMSSGRFRAGVLIPAAAAIVLGAVSFFVCSSADRWTVVNGFDKNRARYNAATEYLAQQPYSKESELPAEYADLSRGSVKRVECAGGKYICSIFTLLEHENRFEGILYVPGNTPVIYYEITNGWSSYAYEDLGGGYAWIVLYK